MVRLINPYHVDGCFGSSMGELSRRKMLQAVGAAGIGASLPSTPVIADEINTPFCDDCEPGAAPFAKYEWDGSSFDLDGGCDVVEFVVNDTEEGGDPIDVSWTSEIFYQGVLVKSSTECDDFTRDETIDNLDIAEDNSKDGMYEGRITSDDLTEMKAISYIVFCVAPCFQVDLVFGPAIENLGNDDGGFYKSRKIAHLWGNTFTEEANGTSTVTKERDGCTISTDGIVADFNNNEATVTFGFDGDCDVTLVSYVAPCPVGFTEATGDQQSIHDQTPTTDLSGSGEHTLTVDLPTVDDGSALCDEFGGFVV